MQRAPFSSGAPDAVLAAAAAAFSGWSHQNTKKELATAEHQLEVKSKEIIALNNAILDERGNTLDHQFLQKEAQLNASATRRELTRYENREPTVIAKPTLVTRKINRAFIKQQERLSCITGDTTACTNTQ